MSFVMAKGKLGIVGELFGWPGEEGDWAEAAERYILLGIK